MKTTDVKPSSLYIGNLSANCTEIDLFNIFSNFGPLLSIRICRNATSDSSLGYAYVNYAEHKDAATALDTVNYDRVRGRAMRVMWVEKEVKSKMLNEANLVVKNLEPRVNDKLLRNVFAKYGQVLSVHIAFDSHGQSKGYGFVQYKHESSAHRALTALQGADVLGRRISVSKFIPLEERQQFERSSFANNVFVRNLSLTQTDEELREMCRSYGPVTSAKIATRCNGYSKGYGFVSFASPENAAKAIAKLNRIFLNGKRLYAAPATRKLRSVDVFVL